LTWFNAIVVSSTQLEFSAFELLRRASADVQYNEDCHLTFGGAVIVESLAARERIVKTDGDSVDVVDEPPDDETCPPDAADALVVPD
jgi:hypothetical protein